MLLKSSNSLCSNQQVVILFIKRQQRITSTLYFSCVQCLYTVVDCCAKNIHDIDFTNISAISTHSKRPMANYNEEWNMVKKMTKIRCCKKANSHLVPSDDANSTQRRNKKEATRFSTPCFISDFSLLPNA